MTSLRLCATAALLVGISAPSFAEEPLLSRAGYYEGSAHWGCDYFKGVPVMSMRMESAGDFWFVVDEAGTIRGEGVARYDFSFGIDWGMNVKLGVSVMNVLGVKLDPKVSLELDPTTAVHRYTLSGEMDGDKARLKLLWADGTHVNLNLVAIATGTMTAGPSAVGTVGGTATTGGVIDTVTLDEPIPPFGSNELTVPLRKLSDYGPYMANLDVKEDTEETSIQVSGSFVQKIDFARARAISKLAVRLPERSENGGRGESGDKGDTGSRGPDGTDGRDGRNGSRGADGKDGRNGTSSPPTEIRSGSLVTSAKDSGRVQFSKPLPTSRYAVSLTHVGTLETDVSMSVSKKTADGFTVTPQLRASSSPDGRITLDWVAVLYR